MTKVVGIRGNVPVPSQMGVVDENVVKQLEDLLARAKAGEMNGIAVAMHYNDNTSTRCYSGEITWSVVGRLFELQNELLKVLQK